LFPRIRFGLKEWKILGEKENPKDLAEFFTDL